MLGSYIRITVDPMQAVQSPPGASGLRIICGTAAELGRHGASCSKVYIVSETALKGIVKLRVIAIMSRDGGQAAYIAAPDRVTVFEPELRELLAPYAEGEYSLSCIFEKSCGAIVFRRHSGNIEFLLIKNRKGGNWGFPKGHIERGESEHDTAIREVGEETGLAIKPLDGFRAISEYHPRGKIYKQVVFFIAEMPETGHIALQQAEIDRYIWADYGLAMRTFRFNNDRNVLTMAKNWLSK